MRIKRTEIIKALRTEPLAWGSWIDYDSPNGDFYKDSKKIAKKINNCTVCAVGAVLRSCTNATVEDIQAFGWDLSTSGYCIDGQLPEWGKALERKQYMSALASYFEWTSHGRQKYTKAYREELVKFVKDNFPKEIGIRLEGEFYGKI